MYTFKEEIRQSLELLPLPLVIDQFIDGKVVPILLSDGFCDLVGMPRETAAGWFAGSQFQRVHPDDVGNVARISREFAHKRRPYDVVFRCRHEDGYHFIHALGKWMTMEDGTDLAVLIYLDVSQSRDIISRMAQEYNLFHEDEFYTDPTTKLPNINYMHQFGDEWVNSLRARKLSPVLMYFDVNSMQSYNNQYGFKKGDELLQLIARVLKEELSSALVIRGAEDHFIVILPDFGREHIIRLLKRINTRVRKEAEGNTTGIQVGICEMGMNRETPESLDHARHALRRLETNLNVFYRFFREELDDLYWNQRYIVENFDKALENGWFKVYYQGIAAVKDSRGVAMEALARWVDPVRGIISPADFIPTLSKYHLIYKMDLYMIRQVCREFGLRKEVGFPLNPISVNLSRQDFDHVDMAAELERIVTEENLEQYGVGRDHLIIEVTEQDMAQATDAFYEQLRRIRRSGFRLWLDDFGSGYSSLNVFSKFDVDLIKFDMDLIRNLDDRRGVNREILRAMTGFCHKLGIHTLAEGVETEEQRAFLEEIGCGLAQGFLFHRPDPLDSMIFKLRGGVRVRPQVTDKEREALI